MAGLSNLPSVDDLLKTQFSAELIIKYGRTMVLESIRRSLDEIRQDFKKGVQIPDNQQIFKSVQKKLEEWIAPTLVQVINATGVILHTNLGRAPLSRATLQSIQDIMGGYSSLEYDFENGMRGSRSIHCEKLLVRITNAEAALVVNNNASALFLIMAALARRKKVIISRTQMVEIGGNFRIPEIIGLSGAHIIEIGTTNQVHLNDYEEALQKNNGVLLKVHHSNYKIIGFSSEASLKDLVTLAQKYKTIVVDDLGSGALLDTQQFGLAHEPTVQESLASGADLVCFSGDKLVGGPQAGIILGRKDLISKIKKHSMARVVRADKLSLAALSTTLLHYFKGEAEREIPVWKMISVSAETLKARATHWKEFLGTGDVISSFSTIGGGSLPTETLPTFVLALPVQNPNQVLSKFRKMKPAIIGRVEADKVIFDPRTVLSEEEDIFLDVVKKALTNLNK